ncbi:hypothetical protein RUM44_002591 [Polyplax serrata]|uniref:Uncharacterized protein n=1 Tax=Polyplax serrata TaxID=468196 RepID=A0ABR1AF68_POLSC
MGVLYFDLVKTHLMLTVREEVEVLKDKITELMDRISQLEVENTILKAHASQETLSQLTSQASQKSQQPPSNSSAERERKRTPEKYSGFSDRKKRKRKWMTVTNRRTSFVDGDKTNNKVTEKSEESGRGRAEKKKPEVVIRKYPESRGIRLLPEGGGSGRQATGNCLAAAHR